MRLRDLSQLYFLRREIDSDSHRLALLRQQAQSPRTSDYSGMPGGSHGQGSPVERLASEIADLEDAIASKHKECLDEEKRLTEYINSVKDTKTRTIMKLRFRDGMSWSAVARRLGPGHTAEMVKKSVYRYLRHNP